MKFSIKSNHNKPKILNPTPPSENNIPNNK